MCSLLIEIWRRVACIGLVIFRGEWLMHWWERVSLFMLRERKKKKNVDEDKSQH